jgi:hypothetical protein
MNEDSGNKRVLHSSFRILHSPFDWIRLACLPSLKALRVGIGHFPDTIGVREPSLVGQRHFRLSFNRKPNGLRELRGDLITRVMPRTRTPLALRLNELCHANVLKRRCPTRLGSATPLASENDDTRP